MKLFKTVLLSAFCSIINLPLFAQNIDFKNGFWMPAKYIEEISVSSTGSIRQLNGIQLLQPITAILIDKNHIYVKAYASDFSLCQFKIIDKNKLLLKNVMINLASPTPLSPPKIQRSHSNIEPEFYLYKPRLDIICLIVNKNSKTDTINFTNKIDGNPILSNDLVSFQGLLNQKFHLYNDKGVLIEQNVLIKTSGKVIGSSLISRIDLKKMSNLHGSMDQFLVTSNIKFKNNTYKPLALQFQGESTINIYKFDISKDRFIILKDLLYVLRAVK